MPTEDDMNGVPNRGLGPADLELEAALSRLTPTAAVARDALLFEAGRRSARGPLLFWRSIAAILGISAGASFLLPTRPPVQQAVEVPAPVRLPAVATVPQIIQPPQQFAYAQLRTLVLRDGPDAIPGGSGDAGHSPIPTVRSVPFEQ